MVSAEPESAIERPAYLTWPEEEKKEMIKKYTYVEYNRGCCYSGNMGKN